MLNWLLDSVWHQPWREAQDFLVRGGCVVGFEAMNRYAEL